MKVSTEIASIYKQVGIERSIELVAKAGFDAWDFTMTALCQWDKKNGRIVSTDSPFLKDNYLAFARRLKQIGLDNGIHCNQSHVPYPMYVKEIADYAKRAIECTAEAGANICVIHPMNHNPSEDNAEMYNELLPFAKEHGVKIATENMWKWNTEADKAEFAACATAENFNKLLSLVDDDYLVACVDIGHSEIMGDTVSAYGLIKALGGKVQALHIHDNDRWHDSHQIPFSMDIDFTMVARALKEINYQGYLTLEAYSYITAPDGIEEKVKELCNSIKRLDEMIMEA